MASIWMNTEGGLKVLYKYRKPLTFTAQEAGSVALTKVGTPPDCTFEYRTDTGGGWSEWDVYTIGDVVALEVGQKMQIRGTNTTLASSKDNYHKFVMTGKIAASGNVSSLLVPKGTNVLTSSNTFRSLFYGCTSLGSAPELPATTLVNSCYNSMFSGCTSLVTAPELPATTLVNYCYIYMFENCNKLACIKVGATEWNTTACFNWVNGVASTGTFTKPTALTIPTGANGMPNGWTINNI